MATPFNTGDLTWHWELLAALFHSFGGQSILELGVGGSRLQDFAEAEVYVGVDTHKTERVTHVMTTDQYFAANTDSFDLIFIDADHDYQQVVYDLERATRRLNEHGLIAIHDTMPANRDQTAHSLCSDAYRLLYSELEKGWERITLHRSPGLTLYARDPRPTLEARIRA